ncbi:Ger(x)C family spore germination protein [Clostridium sp. CX1]|uniref:Ger(x)C family spore germination protein n=1 Tax=Clostridium sp. CX1 TaxID=2978346 RepID=UPI0021BE7D1D|nr:Ger(x)C family spore germination protein [Clostridium sp. CX1]MCT8978436.1 Ger(x)C family spore germination protein [Clostridium sp. CX1]
MIHMKKKRIKKIIILLLILLLPNLFTGCWDQQPIGRLKIDLTMGMDISPEKRLLITRSAPVYEEEISSKSEIITEEVNSPQRSREESRATSYNLTVGGKLQQILFSKELASIGISDLIEVSERDTESSPLAMVIVVDGSTKELLKKANEMKDKPAPGFYINRLIDNNIKRASIPETRVHNFCIAYFAPGIDPIVPRIKLESDENIGIKVMGSALFSGDKLVGEIDIRDTAILLAMMGEMRRSVYSFETSRSFLEGNRPKTASSFSINRTKRKIKVRMDNGIPKVDISLDMRGNVQEYRWGGIKDNKDKSELEKLVGDEITGICEKVLKYTQEVGSDPIGVGSMMRAKYGAQWKEDQWKENYKKTVFNVKVNYTIKHHGVIK